MYEQILLVDDEKQILDALRRTFIGRGYVIFTASSGRQALEIMAKEKIDLIITDVRMPHMNGYELLKEVKEKYPMIIRVILSGYADSSLIVKIQRESLAKRYLYKPWKNQELIRVVEQMFRVEKILKDKNLLQLINRIEYLPSPSNVYHKFNTLARQDADMDKIAKVIETDQSIAAKVLQVANSAMYGINTGSVHKAISYLGLNNVKYIILSATTFNDSFGRRTSRLNRDINMLWKHSVTTNQILIHLYESIFKERIPDTYSALGLLHDIGKVVLMTNFTDKYMKAAESIKYNKDLVYYYEKMEFTDVTSQEIGAYLLNWWELPSQLVEAVLYHNKPLDRDVIDKEIVALLSIAEVYSWNYIYKGKIQEHDKDLLELFKLTEEDFDLIVKEAKISLDFW